MYISWKHDIWDIKHDLFIICYCYRLCFVLFYLIFFWLLFCSTHFSFQFVVFFFSRIFCSGFRQLFYIMISLQFENVPIQKVWPCFWALFVLSNGHFWNAVLIALIFIVWRVYFFPVSFFKNGKWKRCVRFFGWSN